MPQMSVMPQQQQQQQMQLPPPQQYPIYATGTQMNNHPNQNGGPIYVPSSISVQNSLNNVATAAKPSPGQVPPMIPSHQNNNNNLNSNYGHGQMMQQTIPQAPQYLPSLQQQVSVPAAPVPPPPPAFQNSAPCPPPMMIAAQAAPMNGSGAPPPPPPPPASKPGGMDMGSLAAQLQQAKLRKTSGPAPPPAENSGNSTSSSGSGNYGTIGRTSGAGEMASMMDEMAKTLARRRERQKDSTVSPRDQLTRETLQLTPFFAGRRRRVTGEMGEVQHAATQAEQQQFANASIVLVIKRYVVAGRLAAVTEALRKRQRRDNSQGWLRDSTHPSNSDNFNRTFLL